MGLTIPNDEAHLYGLIGGLLIYGIYLPIFGLTMYVLSTKKKLSRVVLSALIMLFICCTSYFILAAYDIYVAFVPDRVTPGTLAHLMDYSDRILAAKNIIYELSLGLADGLLIWRLSCIWPDNKRLLRVVLCLYCSLIVAGIGVAWYETHQTPELVRTLQLWTVGGTVVIITTNLVVTISITLRLRWMGKQITLFGTEAAKVYNSIIFVMIQNGSLYFTVVIMQLLVYAAGISGAVQVILHVTPAIVALFPTAMVLQLNMPGAFRTLPQEPSPSSTAINFQHDRPTNQPNSGITTTAAMTTTNYDPTSRDRTASDERERGTGSRRDSV